MPARSGAEYLKGLRDARAEVWIRGEKVDDVTSHEAFRGGAQTLASLYDMQLDSALKAEMTYKSPTTEDPVGLSYIVPKTVEDLQRRRKMMATWAQASCGMLGRSPDFLNVVISSWGTAGDFFAQNRPEFKRNVEQYYEFIRENDVCLTHTLLNFQQSRRAGLVDNINDQIALTVVKETDAGIVVHGSRLLATLGPISDEIAVYPTRTHMLGDEAWRQSFAFAIPCNTPGMKFLCRESTDHGRSKFDHPLGARFEEMDSIVLFDNVLVPWERVFILGDVEMCNNYGSQTGYTLHTGHQVGTRNVAKAEFMLGLAGLMVKTLGTGDIPVNQQRIADLIVYLEVLKACIKASEADAFVNQWGVMCPSPGPLTAARHMFADVLYPRMVEIIQLLGSSSLMALPSEADFDTVLSPEVSKYLATDAASARDRTKLFHLAWDAACSAFGGRQLLYERYFAGDPVRNAMMLSTSYDSEPMIRRVQEFLDWEEG